MRRTASASSGRPRARGQGRRALRITGGVLLVVVLVAAGLATWTVRRPFPQLDGEAVLAVLDAPVDVARDELGVPSIRASSSRDLFRAQGYVHAQDRFWQMDVSRHTAAGRTAELFGAGQLPSDRFLRTMGWARVAEEEFELLSAESRQILTDYADGVNAYVAERPHRSLGLEYAVLGLSNRDYRPEPWEPVDSLAFLKLMAWDLRSNLDAELERGVLRETLTDEQIVELFPDADGAPTVVAGSGADGTGEAGAEAAQAAAEGAFGGVTEAVAAVDRLVGRPAGTDGIGSNSWVVSGDRTATGLPILANDPHQSIQMPSIWYQVALRCTQRTATCSDDVTGFSFAGVPGVVIGHNDRIAWGFTNMAPDVMDLYVERVDPEDPDRYEVDGETVPFMEVTEELLVAGGEAETLTVRSTRHGPVLTEVYDPIDGYAPQTVDGPYVVALRWTALDPGTTFEALPAMNRARDWESFRQAASLFEVPAQNLVYADTEGTIGYQAPGRIPIRSSGLGRIPAPGWDSSAEWTGYIPFDELPAVTDPAEGFIVTANNPVVGGEYPYLLTTDWDQGYRAARIREELGGSSGVTLQGTQALQGDDRDAAAAAVVPLLLDLASDDERLDTAREVFDGWEYGMAVDSAPAALWGATWSALLARTFHDELPESSWPGASSRWVTVVTRLLDEPDGSWWDDVRTTAVVETRDEVLEGAVADAVDELRDTRGDDPTEWRWGDLHAAEFRSSTLGESGVGPVEALFNRGGVRVGGGTSIVNATAWDPAAGYGVVALPSMRMVIDLGDLDQSLAIHSTGQSGHAFHPHYTSMMRRWAANQQRPLPWTPAAVDFATANTLQLVPEATAEE